MTTSLRDCVRTILRGNPLVIIIEISLVIAVYLLKVNGFFPMSKMPILLIGSLSLWLRGSGWMQLGLGKPESWKKTILIGTCIAILDTLFGWFIILPFLQIITGETMDIHQFEGIQDSIPDLIFWLILSWPYAALMEEMIYRGYLLNRLVDLFGRSKVGLVLGVLSSSLMFGVVHGSMGISGIFNAALSGVLYAVVYIVFGRNLWISVIVHGVGNTIGLLMLFYGLYP